VQSFTVCMPLLTTTSAFGLGRRRWSSPQQCYLHCLRTVGRLTSVLAVKRWLVFVGCVAPVRGIVTKFRSMSMPAGFLRHLVGKTLRNV